MDTNGRVTHRNGHGVAPVAGIGVVLQTPRAVRYGVVLYGRVPSLHDACKAYWVKKRRVGAGRFVYTCSCEANFLGGHLCSHIAAFRLVEGAR